jgi:ATP-binding cassette subfamily B protein
MSDRPQTFRDAASRLGHVIQRFKPQLVQQRRLIIGSIAVLLVSTGLKLLEPWPIKIVFDRVVRSSASRAARWSFIPAIDHLEPKTLLIVAAIAIVVITSLRALAEYLNTIGFALIGNRVLYQVRNIVYQHVLRLPLSFHNKARSGDLTVRVIGDVNMLRDVTATAILPLIANALILVGMWTIMFLMQWQLALLALATVPFLWLRTTRISIAIREAARKQRQREGEMASSAVDSITGMKIVQALSLEDAFAADFANKSMRAQKQDVRNAKLAASLERTVDVLLAIATGLVIYFGARLVRRDELTVGDLIVFMAYLKRAFNPVQDFAKYTGRLAKAAAAGERVLDLLDRTPEVRDLPGAVPAPNLRGELAFENVSFEYEKDRTVLDRITLHIEPGQQIALVGPSGVGKSTVASLVLRLYDPQSGRITIDGSDIRDFTLQSLRQQVSVVLQETLLFAASVHDNIAWGAGGATAEDVEAAAKLANADEFIRAMPNGYDTILGERGVTLSGGQRQRIAIARAAVRRAPVLVLDEPTTGLDEENERIVTDALRKLARRRTTIWITHDLRLASQADLICYMEGGRIVERGRHDELISAGGRYAALFRMQSLAGAPVDVPVVSAPTDPDPEIADALAR